MIVSFIGSSFEHISYEAAKLVFYLNFLLKNNIKINGHHFEMFIDQRTIENRIDEMAKEFMAGAPSDLVMVPVLSGAFYFSARFLQNINQPYRLIGMQASSYDGLQGRKNVNISFHKEHCIQGNHIVVLEDIVDSGRTANELEAFFNNHGAISVSVIALFYKPENQRFKCNLVDYGFPIGPEFIVGYGLDLDEEGRHLRAVYRHVGTDDDL